MENEASSFLVSSSQEVSNSDELFIQQSLLFSDTLKDFRNLSRQLYSAADYFEVSYSKEDHKKIAVETLKDYVVQALINTVDHLGSVVFKVNHLFDEEIGDVSAMELRFSSTEQRLKTCQEYINQCGLLQQSLRIQTPRHHKRYIFPVEERDIMYSAVDAGSNHPCRRLSAELSIQQFRHAVQTTMKGPPLPSPRERRFTLESPHFNSRQGTFAFTTTSGKKKPEQRTWSPQRFLLRSGTILKRSISPNHANARQRYPSEPQRSVSLSATGYLARDRAEDIELYSGKNKSLFKALLSMPRSRNDGSTSRGFGLPLEALCNGWLRMAGKVPSSLDTVL